MQIKPFIFTTLALLTTVVKTAAQPKADSTQLRAAYTDSGASIFQKGISIGVTLLGHNNWFISSHIDRTVGSAPQRPSDFKYPITSYSGLQTQTSGCLFCIDYGFLNGIGIGGNNSYNDELQKHVRAFSFSAGRMWEFLNGNLRTRMEIGVAKMKVKEPVRFVYVPGTVEDIGNGVTLTRTAGYTFSIEERKPVGLLLGIGVELPFSKAFGIQTNFKAILAKHEHHFGLSVGLLLGVLK